MLSSFFIDRPKFAIVIAVVITIAGLLGLYAIPIGQFPEKITPPQITVSATYAGANAQTVADSVAAPIESQVNGVENALYLDSTSSNDGSYSLTVTFSIDSDPNIDQVNTQNRVSLANPRLPTDVVTQGVTVRTRSSAILLGINFFSPNSRYDPVFVSNYASINVLDAVRRIPGVGDAQILGALDYSMRIWMRPDRMSALGVTASDIVNAIKQQNVLASAGQVGAPPTDPGQQQQLTILAKGRLQSPEEFANIIVRTNPNGAVVRVSDVARVELGAQTYDTRSALNGQPAVTLAVYQSPGANALQVATAVQNELKSLSQGFPPGLQYAVLFNTTQFVTATIHEIVVTLGITFAIVVAVVFLFLQDWRATLIPTLAIPVSLVGTFAVLYILGYSANTITLFAIVLAITLVVDDAIVVVENAQRNIEENPDLGAVEATRRGMGQITGPVIATTLVLAAVFVPVAFLPGITGQLYRQFALTIVVSVLISAVNALTLSPALCALLLRPPQLGEGRRLSPFQLFNRGLERTRNVYAATVGWLAGRLIVAAIVLAGVFAGTYVLFRALPTSFLPEEDQGYFFVNVQLPEAASLPRTEAVLNRVQETLRDDPGVADLITIAGFSLIGGRAPNAGAAFVILKPWDERTKKEEQIQGL